MAKRGDDFDPLEVADLVEEEPPEKLEKKGDSETKSSVSDLLKAGFDIASKTFLMLAVIVGYLEYEAAGQEERRQRSFDLVENWETGGFQKANEQIIQKIKTIQAEMPEQYKDAGDASPIAYNYLLSTLLREADAKPAFDRQIQQVYYFYSKVGLCVGEDICDADLLHDYFHTSAHRFLDLFKPYEDRIHATGQTDFAGFARSFVESNSRPD